jgi:hypothetical protein
MAELSTTRGTRQRLLEFLDDYEMSKKPLKEAKQAVEAQMPQLEKHLIKLAVWGDSDAWRTEVKAFCRNVQKIRVDLKSRNYLTAKEYEDQMTDYGALYQLFADEVAALQNEMTAKNPIRSVDEARTVVQEWQHALTLLWEKGLVDDNTVDGLLDAALD